MKYKIAGTIAAFTTSIYGIPTNSAIRNAAAPIIGGIICPPVDAAASTAPAKFFSYPNFFIMGMVNAPLPTTFATELPEIVPSSALESTATFAGPPDAQPAIAFAISMKNFPSPVFSR